MCGCNKQATKTVTPTELDAAVWGPVYWRAFHIIAERIGVVNAAGTDVELSAYVRTLILQIPDVLPCAVCRTHARMYVAAHPPAFVGQTRAGLRDAVRSYFYNFHNNVRISKGQPIVVALSDCEGLYGSGVTMNIPEVNVIEKSLNQASTNYMSWLNLFRRLNKTLGFYR
jgi:hypothetical protein